MNENNENDSTSRSPDNIAFGGLIAADVFQFLMPSDQYSLRACSSNLCEAFDVACHVLLNVTSYTMSQPHAHQFVFGVASPHLSTSSIFADLHRTEADETEPSHEVSVPKPGQVTRWCFAPVDLIRTDGTSLLRYEEAGVAQRESADVEEKEISEVDREIESLGLETENDMPLLAKNDRKEGNISNPTTIKLPPATLVNIDALIECRYYQRLEAIRNGHTPALDSLLSSCMVTESAPTTLQMSFNDRNLSSGYPSAPVDQNSTSNSDPLLANFPSHLDNLLAGLRANCIIIPHCDSILEIGNGFLKGTTAHRVIFGNHSTIFASTSWDDSSTKLKEDIEKTNKNINIMFEEQLLPLDRDNAEIGQTTTMASPFPSPNLSFAYRIRREIQIDNQQRQNRQTIAEALAEMSHSDGHVETQPHPSLKKASSFRSNILNQLSSLQKVGPKFDPNLLLQSLPKKSVMVLEKVRNSSLITEGSFQIVDPVERKPGRKKLKQRVREYYTADSLSVPSTFVVAAIGDQFMSNSSNLSFVDFRGFSQLQYVGTDFLSRCSSLSTASDFFGLGELRTIGHNFLYNSDSLENVNFCELSSLLTIGDNCLSKCPRLACVEIANVPVLHNIGSNFLALNPILKDVSIGPFTSLRIVGHGWLNRCRKLEHVTFRQFIWLEQVGNGWLAECPKLTRISFAPLDTGSQRSHRARNVGDLAGQASGGFELVSIPSTTPTKNEGGTSYRNSLIQSSQKQSDISNPKSPQSKPASSGNSRQTSSINIGLSQTPTFPRLFTVGSHWMYNCPSLKEINFHAAGMPALSNVGNFWLAWCASLASVNLFGLDSLSAVGANWLVAAHSLKGIDLGVLPELRIINSNFLYDCQNLTTINFSPKLKNLTTVGNRFVSQLPSLVSINFKGLKNLTSIGDGFLSDCPTLISVDFSELKNLQSVGNDWFKGSCRVALPPQLPAILKNLVTPSDLSRNESFNGSSVGSSSKVNRSRTTTTTTTATVRIGGEGSTLDGSSFDHRDQDDLYAEEDDDGTELSPDFGSRDEERLVVSEVTVTITVEGKKGEGSKEIESDFLIVTDVEEEERKRKQQKQLSAMKRQTNVPTSPPPETVISEAETPLSKNNGPIENNNESKVEQVKAKSPPSAQSSSKPLPPKPATSGFFSFLRRKKTPEEIALKEYQQSVKEYNQRVSAMFAPLLPHLLGVAGRGSGLSKKQKDAFLRQMLATAQQVHLLENTIIKK